jgi:hypothetical protein
VAEDLLYDADVDALLDQEGRGGVAGVVYSGVSYAGLLEDGLSLLPVLRALDRAAELRREDQIMIGPLVPSLHPCGGLGLLVGP